MSDNTNYCSQPLEASGGCDDMDIQKNQMVYSRSTYPQPSRQHVDYMTAYNNQAHTVSNQRQLADHNNQQSVVNQVDPIRFYPIKHPIGFALLLGNDRTYPMQDHKDRLPVGKDLKLMEEALKEHKWFVSNPCIRDPTLTLGMCDSHLRNLKGNLDPYSCFLFYYSGHGFSRGLLLSDGSCKPYVDIVKSVSAIRSLEGKPKIFVFDSCRSRHEEKTSGLNILGCTFMKEIDKVHSIAKMHNYPPQDTIICYSASEYMEGFSHDDLGSFYTVQLARKLRHFGERLTFTEIVTLTNGGVVEMAQQHKTQQQPVMYCSLNRLLVLNGDGLQDEDLVIRIPQHTPMDTSQPVYIDFKKPLQIKGPFSRHGSPSHGSDVVRDAVRKGQNPKFKSRQDVVGNLPKLGQGLSVFICYAPDPESPYHDPKDRQGKIVHNRILITHLVRDLERLGFTVISDLHLGESQPRNWLLWYVSRIELCDYLIMVCSPAFKELFSCEKPKFPITDERASWFLSYRQVLYAQVAKEINESPEGTKFVPVILDNNWQVEDSVPLLFAMAPTYQLHSDGGLRRFDYDDKNRDFEKLVCRMAGIDRMELDKPVVQDIQKLAAPYGPGTFGGSHVSFGSKPRRGYKQVPSKLMQPHPQPITSTPYGLPPHAQHGSQPHAPINAPLPPQPAPSPPANYPPPLPQPPPPSQASPIPSSLPDKPPHHSIILWLCDSLTNWRFVARYLQLQDAEIERISIDERDYGVREQRYQMFESWRRLETREYNYRTLGDVLLRSEDNKRLYPEYCQRVMERERQT